MRTCQIAPSILSADFARLGDEVRAVVDAGADLIHFDVMDNHYVPNLTVGPLVCRALKPHVSVPIDVHLMVTPVDTLASAFAEAGAAIISFHPKRRFMSTAPSSSFTSTGARPAWRSIRRLRSTASTMYSTSSTSSSHVGQPRLRRPVLYRRGAHKIGLVRARIDAVVARTGREIRLEVDGGVKVDNIGSIARAGADRFVAGSAIFGSGDYAGTMAAMRAEVARAR